MKCVNCGHESIKYEGHRIACAFCGTTSRLSYITLVDGEVRRNVDPPEGFNWQSYPPTINVEGKVYKYFGTQDSPVYQRVG